MTTQNIAIVFGPTLFGQMQIASANGTSTTAQINGGMADATFQNLVTLRFVYFFTCANQISHTQAIETILKHYTDIFVDESE